MIAVGVAPELSLRTLLAEWTFDPLVVAGLAAGLTFYLAGVRRLGRLGRHWPAARTGSFVAGCAVVAMAALSGVAAYDELRFSVHVVQHILLSMAAAVLFVLSAPVTLALQASSRPAQHRLLKVLHSPAVSVVTHPIVVFALFAGSLFVLYFTGLYDLSVRDRLVHDGVHLHFLLAGSLFFWLVLGLDVMPRRLPYGARLMLVLATVPVHAFLGIALMSSNTPLFSAHTLADQRAGAGILWAVGDLITLVAGGIVLAQWMSHEEKVAAREDRRDAAPLHQA